MSKNGTATSVSVFNMTNLKRTVFKKGNRRLAIVINSSTLTKPSFAITVKLQEQMFSRHIWLLRGETLDSNFSIPFNSKVFMSKISGSTMTLTLINHVERGGPMIAIPAGVWSRATGILPASRTGSDNVLEQRGNLQGVELLVTAVPVSHKLHRY